MSLKPYPKCKNTGVLGLGEVPDHWEMKRLKHVGRFKAGAGFPHEEQGMEGEELDFHKVNALAQADLNGYLRSSENTISKSSAARLGAFEFPQNTIVFAKIGAALLLGRIRLLNRPACIDNNLMGLIIYYECSFEFVRYFMDLVRFDLIANPGTVPSLNESQIANVEICIPPATEQLSIVKFLTRETAKIDALIAEQEKLISLLAEKRQATISHAVTKGLNPHVKMKDSGVEWLGEVPEHWEVLKLKRIASLQSGDFITAEQIEETGDFPVYGGNGLRGYTQGFTHEGRFALIGRQGALCGNINYANGRFWASEHAVVATPQRELNTIWLGEMLRAMNLNQYSLSAAQPGLSVELISNLRVPFPQLDEQRSIGNFISNERTKIDSLVSKANELIELLKERRTALISAAVTGKIDVRNAVEAETVVA